MTLKFGTFSATAVLLSAVAWQLSGCARNEAAEIVPARAADLISRQVQSKSGFTPTDITCPPGIEAKVGAQFACTFAGPKGKYAIRMTVTKVDGGVVDYDMSWRITELADSAIETPPETTTNPDGTDAPTDTGTPGTPGAPPTTDDTNAPDTPNTDAPSSGAVPTATDAGPAAPSAGAGQGN